MKRNAALSGRILQRSLTAVIASLLCLITLAPGRAFAAPSASALIDLHNDARANAGISLLSYDGQLTYAAQKKAEDMLANQYFAHTSPAGVTPWSWIRSADYTYDHAGENLSIDFTDASSAFQAWMQSPSHRDNVMNRNYSDIGVGITTGTFEDHETTVMVVMFGHRSSAPEPTGTTGGLAGLSSAKPARVAAPRDTTPPAPPIIRSPGTDSLMASEVCNVSGEAEARSTVVIYNNGEYWAETTSDDAGQFITLNACISGAYSIAATATDAAGNQSAPSETVLFTIDTIAPQVDPTAQEYFSHDVIQSHTFLTRIKLLEPAIGLSGTARIGNETFNLIPNNEAQTLELVVTSPDTTGELPINFTLTDSAGNTIDLPAGYTNVITSYDQPASELPLQKVSVLWAGLHFPPGPNDALKVAIIVLVAQFSVVGTVYARKARARTRR